MKLKDAYSLEENLDNIFKSRDIALPTKVHIVKAMVFPIVTYRCESWITKKAEHRRIDAFGLSLRLSLRVSWTPRRSNQSFLKEINPKYSLEGLTLKLKLQHSSDLMWRADSMVKTLMLRKIEDMMRRGQQRKRWLHHQLNGHEFEQTLEDSEGQGSLACCSLWGRKELDTNEWVNSNNKKDSIILNITLQEILQHSDFQ